MYIHKLKRVKYREINLGIGRHPKDRTPNKKFLKKRQEQKQMSWLEKFVRWLFSYGREK